jgi:alpha-amylase
MKRISATLISFIFPLLMMAQGWPANYPGVMLQGFYWDSYSATQWTNLQSQADELSQYFSLVWIPQSAYCGGQSMGYDDLYWFSNYNSSFGTENELRSLITTFKNKGIGTIADVVINHRKTLTSWTDFPSETYKGTEYQLQSTDICANDDGGKTKTWATNNGISLSANNDSGEGWDGMRDLDHSSSNVQNNVKAYLNMLLSDFGYAGFRYDMVKGYAGSYTGIYNSYANPTYSVGEYWDGNAYTVKNWLNTTKVNNKIQSAAFDFPFRYTVRDAINNSNWLQLGNTSVMSDESYRQYAVTFVENHDTEKRSNAAQDPIKKDTLAANAFMLAMPGTPCVFLKHWIDCKQEIKAMIDARKAAGITNTSTVNSSFSTSDIYSRDVVGTNGNLLVCVGKTALLTSSYTAGFTKVLDGYHYAYYLSNNLEIAWANKASGEYEKSVDVTLTAVTATSGAKLVYTTDGTAPSASNGTQVTSGTKITLTSTSTLKVGLLINGTVNKMITRDYKITNFTPTTATVYVQADWATTYFYAWDDSGTLLAAWPGTKISDTKTINGKTWYYHSFPISKSGYTFNIIFNQGSSTAQTVDINNISSDKYYVLSTTANSNGKYTVTDVTSTTGINGITTDNSASAKLVKVYTISGQLLRSLPKGTSVQNATDGLPHGIYIVDNKKIAK